MKFLNQATKWLMLVSGVITVSMFYGVFAPQAALQSMFGVSFSGVLENLIVRSWSALVGLMGVMLIYGFFAPSMRRFAITIAALSKLIFVSLVVVFGQTHLAALIAPITMDVMVIVVAAIYLMSCGPDGSASQ